jgi:hypothetical protein
VAAAQREEEWNAVSAQDFRDQVTAMHGRRV